MTDTVCPNCSNHTLEIFYEVRDVPVHNVLLMRSEKQAKSFPAGDIRLAFCSRCAFIGNIAFEQSRMIYSEDCEESQAGSNVFRRFHQQLAETLVKRYELTEKTVLEIGCGKGEFLEQLCQAGCGQGIGFDPAYLPGRISTEYADRISVHHRNYTPRDRDIEVDFICCKMTLEHIPDTKNFISMLAENLSGRGKIPVFFMMPDTSRILMEGAFWDIYYEHCSYFTDVSLRSLFEQCGFAVSRLERLYDQQYLAIDAVADSKALAVEEPVDNVDHIAAKVKEFTKMVGLLRKQWQEFLQKNKAENKTVVIWGGSSKAVAFITTMNVSDEVDYVIDIHPRKQGCYLPGSGHQVMAPRELLRRPADVIIVMNPVYLEEIRQEMQGQGCNAVLLTVNQPVHFL